MAEVVTGPSEQEEQPAVYTDIFQAPVHLRLYKNARLSLKQINDIVADAYANKIPSGDSAIPDFGGAKVRFEATHKIEKNFWVQKTDEETMETK